MQIIQRKRPVTAIFKTAHGQKVARVLDRVAVPSFSIGAAVPAAQAEGNSGSVEYRFPVTRAVRLDVPASIDWAVSGTGSNPASSGDFNGATGGTITFAPGETTQWIPVFVKSDLAAEANEAFSVTLSNPSMGGITVATSSATIIDDDTDGAPVDSTPDPFTFTDVTGVALSSAQTSNAIIVSGLGSGVSVTASVSGGQHSKNGGSFTLADFTVVNGDTVQVRHTSSASNSTTINTTETIGGVSDTFTSTTVAAAGTLPVNSVAPAVIGDAIDGQVLYCDTGTWSNSPTSYAYAWVYTSDTSTVLSTDDYYPITDIDVGKTLKCQVTAANSFGSASIYSNTKGPIAEIDLSADAPLHTRTSSSGASPLVWSTAWGSKTYAGYFEHLQVASDVDFTTLLYDGLLELTEDMFTSLSAPWSTLGVPALSQSGWPSQVYLRSRIETASPLGVDFLSPWSDVLTKTDLGAFSPDQLGSMLKLWLKDTGLPASGSITTWSDSSGNSNNVSGGTNKPTVNATGLNGRKTAAFAAASNQEMLAPSAVTSGATEGFAIVVSKIVADPPPSTAKSGAPLGEWGNAGGGDHGPWTDGGWYTNFGSNARKDTTTTAVTPSTAFRILSWRSKTDDWEFDVNAVNKLTVLSNSVAWGGSPTLGHSAGSGAWLDGEIAEVIFCSNFMTTSQKQKLEGYLAHRHWGAGGLNPLPSGHPYKTTAP